MVTPKYLKCNSLGVIGAEIGYGQLSSGAVLKHAGGWRLGTTDDCWDDGYRDDDTANWTFGTWESCTVRVLENLSVEFSATNRKLSTSEMLTERLFNLSHLM